MAGPSTDVDDEEDEVTKEPNNPASSGAGRGGIVSPGGQQPMPSEDPRNDAGLEPQPEPKE